MSHSSHSELPRSAKLSTVRELIYSLGYKRYSLTKELPTQTDNCFWFDHDDYRSWSGVELQVYRTAAGRITVDTRTTISRSYWDLVHQSRTIKLLRDCFGGSFTTDEGKGRHLRPASGPPTPLSSGCYLANWNFLNAIRSTRYYVRTRKVEPANKKLLALMPHIANSMPEIISSNLVLPYLVAVWEENFRATFTASLQYIPQRDQVLKRTRLTSDQLEKVLGGHSPIERALAETFSFQRPSAITENFRLLDRRLDLGSALRRPYRRRRRSLFDSIEAVVERRNAIVHSGTLDSELDGKKLEGIVSDFEVAADRAYEYIGRFFGFRPIHAYK